MGSSRSEAAQRVFEVVRRRAVLIGAIMVVAIGGALVYSLHTQKKYTATAAILFNNAPVSQSVAGLQPVENIDPVAQQDTNLQLLVLGNLARLTAAAVGHGLTASEIRDSIGVAPDGDTTIVNLTATLPSPTLAAAVANTYASNFVSQQETQNRTYYNSALQAVENQLAKLTPRERTSAEGLSLATRAQSLATLVQLRSNTAQVAQAATVPTAPSSPDTKRNVVLAAFLGLVLALGLVLLLERMDSRIHTPSELEELYELPLLGVVPSTPKLRRRAGAPPLGHEIEAFRFIRAHLQYFNVDRELRVLVVVSSSAGDGKTTVAQHVATVYAASGVRTLLIEADLRRPTLAAALGADHSPGLADVLIGSSTLEDAIQRLTYASDSDAPADAESLAVLVAGALPPNPTEMLESEKMKRLLVSVRSEFDMVVVDTPPMCVVSDAYPLLRQADGVVVVASVDQTHRDVAKRLRDQLKDAGASTLGVVANRVKSRASEYGSGYGYGDYGTVSGSTRPGDQTEQLVGSPTESSPQSSDNGAATAFDFVSRRGQRAE
jgi:capsular exopolysaccharide synthesis family protein